MISTRWLPAALFVSALSLTSCAPVVLTVQDNALQGDFLRAQHAGSFHTGSSRVDLPAGTWNLIARETLDMAGTQGQTSMEIMSVRRGALVRVGADKSKTPEVDAFVYFLEAAVSKDAMAEMQRRKQTIQSDIEDSCQGIRTGEYLHYWSTLPESSDVRGCWLIGVLDFTNPDQNMFVVLDEAMSQGFQEWLGLRRPSTMRQQIRDYLKAENIRVTINMPTVLYMGARDDRIVMVLYAFNPDLQGIPQTASGNLEQSDWNPRNIGRFPDKQAYIQRLQVWGSEWQNRFVRGLLAGGG